MEPKPDSLGRAADLFEQALSRPPSDRAGFVQQSCGDDELRDMLADMLAAHERQGEFLAQPTGPLNDSSIPCGEDRQRAACVIDPTGARIGGYTLIERIGEGGFGQVWRARQDQPVQRQVALKILKLGMDTRQVIARFEAERQALAIMDHPSIARVLDAGATEAQSPLGPGRPYFVMELVHGVPITQFCSAQRLTLRERLALFIDTCHAVQHAHQKGIIHRDLKPSNVLVTPVEGGIEASDDRGAWASGPPGDRRASASGRSGLVKIIDFGIAKAIAGASPLTDKTLFTEMRQLLGTPAYMSPEQAGLSDLDIDTRSDIYSLGVLLYELLTGTTPFNADRLRKADFDELRRIIREEDPPKPSTRLSSLRNGASDPRVGRLSEPLAPAMRTSEPLAPSMGMSEPVAPATGSAAFSNLKSEISDSSAASFSPSSPRTLDPSIPRSLCRQLRGDLDWIVMKCLEKDRSRRYETASGLAADVQRFLNGEPVVAAPPDAIYRLRKFIQRHRGAVLTTTLVAISMVAGMVGTLWQAARATDERNRAVAAHRRALKVKSLLERTLTASSPMHTALKSGLPQSPLKPDVKLIEVLDGIAPTLEGEFDNDPEVEADVRFALGKSYFGLSRFAESRKQLEGALDLYRNCFGPDDPRALECLNILGFNYWWISALDRAESAFREAVAGFERRGDPRAPQLADAKLGLALFLYNSSEQFTESVRLAREALALRRQIAAEDSRDVFMAKSTLAHVLRADEDSFREAQRLANEALEQCLRTPHSRDTVDEWFCRIQAFDYAVERVDEAEEHGRNLVRIGDQIAGPDSLLATLGRTRLAHCLRNQRRWADAEEFYRQSLKSQRKIFDAHNGHTMDTANGLAEVCFEQWRSAPEKVELRDEAELLALEVAESWIATPTKIRGTPDAALLIQIYDARHLAEPDAGFDRRAAEWRAQLPPAEGAASLNSPQPDAPERAPPAPSP